MQSTLIIGMNGYVAAIDKTSGKELWRTKLAESIFSAARGSNVSVLLDEDLVIAGCNGHVFGIEAMTGKKLWQNEMKGAGYGDISLSINGASVQYIEKVVKESSHDSSGTRYGSNHT